jgi:hypothetical protein
MRVIALVFMAAGLTACTAPSMAARQRAIAAAAQPPGPRGIYASPPGDPSFDPLRCRIDGPETVCKRTPE